jgi:hypothetical protein
MPVAPPPATGLADSGKARRGQWQITAGEPSGHAGDRKKETFIIQKFTIRLKALARMSERMFTHLLDQP